MRQLLFEINEVLSDSNKFSVEEVQDDAGGASSNKSNQGNKNSLMSSLTMNDIANIASTVEEQDELLDLHQSKKDFQARIHRTEAEKS